MAKVLLIIHDELLASAYRARFLRERLDIERCAAGQTGLAKARQWSPDLIVLDLALPGMTGLDVLKSLRDVPWLAKVRVFVLVERTVSESVISECLWWGAEGCVLKDDGPLDALIALVRSTLEDANAQPAAGA